MAREARGGGGADRTRSQITRPLLMGPHADRRAVRRSLLFSSADRYSSAANQLIVSVVVARLLTPAEIGMFMLGSAVVTLIESFREFGVSSYLIQERHITTKGVHAAFTVALGFSALFAALLWALAGPIADFYDEPGLVPIVRYAAIGFLLAPFTNTSMALLRREMAFHRTALINVSSSLMNSVIAIAFAELGLGAMSLVWGLLAASTTAAALSVMLRPASCSFRLALGECRKVSSFGGFSSATVTLNMVFQMLPQLVLGRILNLDAVALYSRATLLCQLPERSILSALSPVMFSALAARARLGEDLKEPYLSGIGFMTAVQWPFLVCLALLADPIVYLLLGAQWSAVAPVLRIMALASLFLFPAFMTFPVLVSVGRVKDTLTSSLITLPASLGAGFAAAFFGLEAVAASLFLTAPFQVYVALRFVRRTVPFTWSELAAACRKSAIVTLHAAAAPGVAIALGGLRFDLSLSAMIVAGLGAAVGWLIGLKFTAHPLLREVNATLRLVGSLACIWTKALNWRHRRARVPISGYTLPALRRRLAAMSRGPER